MPWRCPSQHAWRQEVNIISGGGTGHAPAHGGYAGSGMLTAAVAGPVFIHKVAGAAAEAGLSLVEVMAEAHQPAAGWSRCFFLPFACRTS
ncbi:dihydroxyacetone kinase subunit DhaK [Cupriavidus basilensis]|uniref:Dihydroxyacetone kinase subunit DhaK n=1 Tax=Cupriavidus basilensis TaxID=68895 RepID=A0A643FUN1_9BURK|nr:dihydroxyacetone kinase subunit DhaK [Cupriavidus basilensis]